MAAIQRSPFSFKYSYEVVLAIGWASYSGRPFYVCGGVRSRLLPMPGASFPHRWWLPAGLAWGAFGSMAGLVARDGQAPFDAPLLLELHRHATLALDQLALFFTILGNTGPMIAAGVLTTAALVRVGRRRAAGLFGVGVGGSMLLTQVIKYWVARPRPALWLSIRPEHTLSFPSGHAMDTAALATALFFVVPRRWRGWWGLAPLFALAVGGARLYLGVHYPSDVLAGWSSGVGWVLLVQLVATRWPHRDALA